MASIGNGEYGEEVCVVSAYEGVCYKPGLTGSF